MMNASQVKYARERVDSILREKTDALSAAYHRGFTDTQKLKALKAGEFTVNRKAQSMSEAICYTNAPEEMPSEDYHKRLKELRDYAAAIKDKLILGDEQEALKLITDFRKEGA